jgi:hypothetical protein
LGSQEYALANLVNSPMVFELVNLARERLVAMLEDPDSADQVRNQERPANGPEEGEEGEEGEGTIVSGMYDLGQLSEEEEAQVITHAAERAAAATPHHGEREARGGGAAAENDASGGETGLGTAVGTECNTGGAGYWKFTIGLVGKPSAGKSSFFNAVSHSRPTTPTTLYDSGLHRDAE